VPKLHGFLYARRGRALVLPEVPISGWLGAALVWLPGAATECTAFQLAGRPVSAIATSALASGADSREEAIDQPAS
jgi:hypothetical protein